MCNILYIKKGSERSFRTDGLMQEVIFLNVHVYILHFPNTAVKSSSSSSVNQHTHTCTRAHSHTHTHAGTLSLTHKHTHTHACTHSHTHTHTAPTLCFLSPYRHQGKIIILDSFFHWNQKYKYESESFYSLR